MCASRFIVRRLNSLVLTRLRTLLLSAQRLVAVGSFPINDSSLPRAQIWTITNIKIINEGSIWQHQEIGSKWRVPVNSESQYKIRAIWYMVNNFEIE